MCSLESNSAASWTVAHQASLSMGFPMQEYWSGLPCLLPGNLPHPGINPCPPWLLHWQADFLYHWTTWEALMLGKFEGNRTGWQRMRWLDSIINSTDINLSKLWEIVKDRGAWPAAIHGITKSWTRLSTHALWNLKWIRQQQLPKLSSWSVLLICSLSLPITSTKQGWFNFNPNWFYFAFYLIFFSRFAPGL